MQAQLLLQPLRLTPTSAYSAYEFQQILYTITMEVQNVFTLTFDTLNFVQKMTLNAGDAAGTSLLSIAIGRFKAAIGNI